MVDTVVRTAPVAVLVSVIVELGTTAPVASAMWPDMDPEAWANNLEGPPTMPRRRTKTHRIRTPHLSIDAKTLKVAHAARGVFLALNRVVRGEPVRLTRSTERTWKLNIVFIPPLQVQLFLKPTSTSPAPLGMSAVRESLTASRCEKVYQDFQELALQRF